MSRFVIARVYEPVVDSGFCGCRWLWCDQGCLGIRLMKLTKLGLSLAATVR